MAFHLGSRVSLSVAQLRRFLEGHVGIMVDTVFGLSERRIRSRRGLLVER